MRDITLHNLLFTRGYSEKTVKEYMNAIYRARDFMREHHTTLDTCSGLTVARFCDTLPPSRSSRVIMKAALTAYWDITYRQDPPTGAIRVPMKPRRKTRAIDHDDFQALMKTAYEWDSGPEGLAVLFGAKIALRRFEIAKLKWDEFKHDFTWVEFVGKGDKEAKLPVRGRLRERLLWWRDDYVNPTDPTDCTIRRGDTYVFPAGNNNCHRPHIAGYTVSLWLDQVCERAGIPRCTPHQLRHTCLTELNDAGHNLRQVQEFARHENPEVTAGYTRVKDEQLEALADALD